MILPEEIGIYLIVGILLGMQSLKRSDEIQGFGWSAVMVIVLLWPMVLGVALATKLRERKPGDH